MNTVLDWSIAVQKLQGEPVSGDLCLVKQFADGFLLAVIDGIGHGTEAAAAAGAAADALETSAGESVIFLMEKCHKYLIGTRGAAVSLASFNKRLQTLTWLGVGNVEGIVFFDRPENGIVSKSFLLRPGIVGSHLPPLLPSTITVKAGDTLVVATDGIRYDFARDITLAQTTQQIADRILSRHSKDNDDSLVLVARFGEASYE